MSYYPTFCPPRVLTAGQYGYIAGGLGIRQGHSSYSLDCSPIAVNVPTNLTAALNGDENGIILNWTDAANNEFGYLIERSTTSASTGFVPLLYGFTGPNDTNFTDNDIASGQQYWYRIKASNGDCDTYSAVASITLGTIYCSSVASSAQACDDDEYVARVIFGRDFNHGTDCTSGGYENYTQLSISVTTGESYNIRVNNGVVSAGVPTELSGYTGDRCGIWIDWNQDGDFEDAEESITPNTDDAPFYWTTALSIPNDAVLGDTRMRVRIVYNETPTACGLSTYGETEDYTVSVTSSPLPVAFSTFTALRKGRSAILEWETLTESNNDYFSIEHATDARNFTAIGQVPGQGTTFTPQIYSFTDQQPYPGINYYRLRQVDFDGRFEYSEIRSVPFPVEPDELFVYPNPSQGTFHIQVPRSSTETADLQLFDSQGRMLRQIVVGDNTNLSNTFLGKAELSPGLYFLKWQDEQRSLTVRLIIQK